MKKVNHKLQACSIQSKQNSMLIEELEDSRFHSNRTSTRKKELEQIDEYQPKR
jgi:hypothetical protein